MARGRLDDLVDQVTAKASGRKPAGFPYVGLEHIEPGARRLMGVAPSSISESTNGVFARGDILFGKLRPNLRKAIQVDCHGYCSTDFLILRPKAGVDPRYASHVVASEGVFRHAERNSIGTGMPRTSWHAVSQAQVWVPPLQEQRRIAETLDTLDETVRAIESTINKLEAIRIGVIEDKLSVEKTIPLGDLASVTVGFVGPTQMYYTNHDRGVPFLRTGNIGRGEVHTKDLRYITHEFNRANQKSILQAGDVVVSRVGYTGTAAIIRRNFAGANCANMTIIRPNSCLNSEYLSLLFESSSVRKQVDAMTAGSAQPVFNIQLVERLLVPEVELAEQRRFIESVQMFNRQIKVELESQNKLVEIRSGLADDLLSGRVRTVAA